MFVRKVMCVIERILTQKGSIVHLIQFSKFLELLRFISDETTYNYDSLLFGCINLFWDIILYVTYQLYVSMYMLQFLCFEFDSQRTLEPRGRKEML
jgi:hypothetical protein